MPCYEGPRVTLEVEELTSHMSSDSIKELIQRLLDELRDIRKERDQMGNLLCDIGKSNEGADSSDHYLSKEFWDWWKIHKERDSLNSEK